VPKLVNPATSRSFQALAVHYTAFADVFKDSLANEESDTKLGHEALAAEPYWKQVMKIKLVWKISERD